MMLFNLKYCLYFLCNCELLKTKMVYIYGPFQNVTHYLYQFSYSDDQCE